MATWDLRRLQQALDRHPPAPLYLIFGEEAFLVEECLRLLRVHAVSEAAADFNFDQFFATEATPGQVRDAAEMLPVLSERRLVIYRGVENIKEKSWEVLYPLLDQPLEGTCLVLVAERVDKRKKYFKRASEKGILVELKRPYENQIPGWIDYIAYRQGLEFAPEAALMLQQMVGSNLTEIHNEVLKLQQYVHPRTRVLTADVLEVVSRARMDNIFDLTNAIGRRDRSAALVHLANLLENGQNAIGALSLILRHVRILASLREGKKLGLSSQKLAERVGVSPFFMTQYIQQIQAWDEKKIAKTIGALHRTDMALKSSPLSAHIWLENFILQTCGTRE